ncbi:MAG: hypothetical protein ACK4YM_01835 [Novosphingobium sp.]
MPRRFPGLALSNCGLPAGQQPPRAFAIWRAFTRYSPLFPIGKVVQRGSKRSLSPAEAAADDAPLPTRANKIAARTYPGLVPFADNDPITRGGAAIWLAWVPGNRGMQHRTLHGGHFIQEDDPADFASAIIEVAQTPLPAARTCHFINPFDTSLRSV